MNYNITPQIVIDVLTRLGLRSWVQSRSSSSVDD